MQCTSSSCLGAVTSAVARLDHASLLFVDVDGLATVERPCIHRLQQGKPDVEAQVIEMPVNDLESVASFIVAVRMTRFAAPLWAR